MAAVSHQTIKLSKGKHDSPKQGACVMELASMLAGESFSDHPKSVCPVIGSFLRAYNDAIDDRRRQDLYAYAAKVVGSRGSQDVQHARAERLISWMLTVRRRRWTRFLLLGALPTVSRNSHPDVIGGRVVRSIPSHTDQSHAEVLSLIDELLAIGGSKQPASVAAPDDERVVQPAR